MHLVACITGMRPDRSLERLVSVFRPHFHPEFPGNLLLHSNKR